MTQQPTFSFCIPTLNRPETLATCLKHIERLRYDKSRIETLVIDNGRSSQTQDVVDRFQPYVRYIPNEKNFGLGYSINRGFREAGGNYIVSMNDDAMLPVDFCEKCQQTFEEDSSIGIVGVRAIEEGLSPSESPVGQISPKGKLLANFANDYNELIDVEHVYGFCYVISRAALKSAGPCDETLLAQPYSNSSRIDTDHCLSVKRAGFRVVYAPEIAVEHLALPRPDLPEKTLQWHFHDVRNTSYLYLKHFGVLGRNGMPLRYLLFDNLGIRSAILKPSFYNLRYFWGSLSGRLSAIRHYMKHRISQQHTGSRTK